MLFFTAYDIVQLNIKQLLLDLKADIEAGFVIVKVVDWWIAEPVKTDDNSLRNAQTTLDCSDEVSRYTTTQKTQNLGAEEPKSNEIKPDLTWYSTLKNFIAGNPYNALEDQSDVVDW